MSDEGDFCSPGGRTVPKSLRFQMTPKPDVMNCRLLLSVPLFLAALLVASLARGVAPTADELSEARQWAAAKFQGRQGTSKTQPGQPNEPRAPRGTTVPFSFNYDGRSSDELLRDWPLQRSSRERGPSQTEHTLTWTDPNTGLQVRCVALEYHDFPAVEWTLYFKNAGTNDTPILSDIQSLHVEFQRASSKGFVLHHQTGDNCTADSYEPHQRCWARIRSSVSRLPAAAQPRERFPISTSNTMAVGRWRSSVGRASGLRSSPGIRPHAGRPGRPGTDPVKLHPGEEVAVAARRAAVLERRLVRSQNLWRRWMVAHNLPRPGGKLVPTHYGGCVGNLSPAPTRRSLRSTAGEGRVQARLLVHRRRLVPGRGHGRA